MFTLDKLKLYLPNSFYDELAQIDDGVARFDTFKEITNQEIERITGYTKAEIDADAMLRLTILPAYAWLIAFDASSIFDNITDELLGSIKTKYKLAVAKLESIAKVEAELDGDSKTGIIKNVAGW